MNFNKVLQFLENKRVSLVVLLLAIAARITLQLYFFSIWDDRSFQMVASKSFVEGHGFSIPQIQPDNLDTQTYSPLAGWPPGYSIFLSALYFICNKNIAIAAIVLEIITSVLFIFFLNRLLLLLDLPQWLITMYTLMLGFFIYDFAASSTSDFPAVVFFVIGLYCVLTFIRSEKRSVYGIFIGLVLFLPPLTRYMYYLIALMPSLYLIWTGYIQKNKRLFKGGLYCIATLIFLFTGLMAYQFSFAGSTFYTTVPQKGFHPSNLLATNPVLFGSFIDIQVLCSVLQSLFGFDFIKQVDVIRYIHLIPLTCALAYGIFYLIKMLKKNKTLLQHYFNLGILSSLNIVFLLLFLSLTHAPEYSTAHPWTYVQEPRYYAFVTIFFQQVVIIILFLQNNKNWILKACSIICAILFGIQILHGVYFVGRKIASEHNNFRFEKNKEEVQKFLYASLDQLQRLHPKQKIIAVADDLTIQNLAVLKGYSGLYETGFLNNQLVSQPAHVVFLAVFRESARKIHQRFLQQPSIKLKGVINGYYFYTLET